MDLVTAVGQEFGMMPSPYNQKENSIITEPSKVLVVPLPQPIDNIANTEEKEMEDPSDEDDSSMDNDEHDGDTVESSDDDDVFEQVELVPHLPPAPLPFSPPAARCGYTARHMELARISEGDEDSTLGDSTMKHHQRSAQQDMHGADGCADHLAFTVLFCAAFGFDDYF